MSSSWKERAGFLAPKEIEHTVAGTSVKFWPPSMRQVAKLRVVGGTLAKSLITLWGTESEQDTGKIVTDTETMIQPIEPALAQLRQKQRAEAVEEAIGSLLSSETLGVVGELLIDSMREVFPPEGTHPPGLEITNSMTPQELKECLHGLIKANSGAFGPFASSVGKVLNHLVSAGQELINKKTSNEPGTS